MARMARLKDSSVAEAKSAAVMLRRTTGPAGDALRARFQGTTASAKAPINASRRDTIMGGKISATLTISKINRVRVVGESEIDITSGSGPHFDARANGAQPITLSGIKTNLAVAELTTRHRSALGLGDHTEVEQRGSDSHSIGLFRVKDGRSEQFRCTSASPPKASRFRAQAGMTERAKSRPCLRAPVRGRCAPPQMDGKCQRGSWPAPLR